MAGGKQSPRQKMINMMYLVLTALLALNISKDILKALTKIDTSLDQTVSTVDKKNQLVYSSITALADKNPAKAGEWNKKAQQVKKESDALVKEIEAIKKHLIEETGSTEIDESGNEVPIGLDNKEVPANYLLVQKKGEELRKKIDGYRTLTAGLTEDPGTKAAIESRFNTQPVVMENSSVPAEWEHANFEHYPLAAILPFLTDIEAKIRNTESDMITEFRSKIGGDDIKVNKIRAIVEAPSYVTQNSKFEAKIYLAAFDDTQKPIIMIGDTELSEENIANGQGLYSTTATGNGLKTISGEIRLPQLSGEDKVETFTHTYTVAPPSVVISPTKMNVLYRSVQNPLEISVPGVDPSKLRVSGPGVSGSNGQYMANVTNVSGTDVTISVSVEETDKDGKKTVRNMGSKPFRIKGLPPAQGTVYKRPGGKFARNLVENATIEAEYKDFPFDLPLTVTSFEVAIPGFPPEQVRGNRMTASIAQRLQTLKPNATIVIRDIKASGPGGLVVKDVSAIPIDVN